MIKKTLYFENPAYLSLKDSQMLIRLPEVERSTSVNADFKKRAERTIPIEDIGGCLCLSLDTSLKAIHNISRRDKKKGKDVYAYL